MRWAVGNPALKNRPGDSKIKYLKSRLALSDEEVKQAFQKVVQIEQFMSQKKAAAAAQKKEAEALAEIMYLCKYSFFIFLHYSISFI